jgi:predicted helicase
MNQFQKILQKYRSESLTERFKGDRFERLMKSYLLTDPLYAAELQEVWLWEEFPGRDDLGGQDTGIDLVALTKKGDYWAIQCKCYKPDAIIDKTEVDSFLSTSSREFRGSDLKTTRFSRRIWISTTNKWGKNATLAIKDQNPPVTRINESDLEYANVDWVKIEGGQVGVSARIESKKLRAHQEKAIQKTIQHFQTEDRGKLIMACGTGKTFMSLKLAEQYTNKKGFILFLVPSIALLGQTLREWSNDASEQIHPICICSDPKITKDKRSNDDGDGFSIVDLAYPASTDIQAITRQLEYYQVINKSGLTVVFSTYQSIDVVAKAQKHALQQGLPAEFDLVICDEAHRTTGAALTAEDSSAFIKVHDNDFIRAKKRLYMTATPRLYGEEAKSKAARSDAILCSMDDESLYGKEIYRIGFGEAVEQGLLADYKVLILTLSEKDISPAVQRMIASQDNEITTDDASKLIGCVNALSKQVLGDNGIIKSSDPSPMKRAVAFCSSIKNSQHITNSFNSTSESYIQDLPESKREEMVSVSSKHIDGSMSAPERDSLLSWLKEDNEDNNCRVLTNVRCLSEGVDVPSLDAVLFLSARNSQVDVVQSVGRVMRKSEGKKYGYIIIPVMVPSDVDAEKALDDNDRYKVVWSVLNALRAHDDRFNATVNSIELNHKKPDNILVGRPEYGFEGGEAVKVREEEVEGTYKAQQALALQFHELQDIIFARLVKKVGERHYWEEWAKNIADIAESQVSRIKKIVHEDGKHKKDFEEFIEGLRSNINPSITEEQAIDMLSQHIITKPVFEALFEGYSFVKNNPISISMQKMLDILESETKDEELELLDKFYQSVKSRAQGIDNAEGKQKIIIELYDKFFKAASPKMVEQLGIVYTPVEVVDFIIHSVNDVLKQEFGRTLSDENIHILDPFTGTGTFITRLLQSGLISLEDLERKYRQEIFANEIVLLAYYIAAVNIESVYHDLKNQDDYTSFEGICLTDTFQLGETSSTDKGVLISSVFPQNLERVERQKNSPLRIIFGNPPYSIGQKSANDNAQNQKYDKLDQKISDSYAKLSSAGLSKSLYDAYIKAFRWSSDRLDPQYGGIIAFVSNGSWLDGNSTDGFRKSLQKEFSSIYVFNLRGNQRTSGELSRQEGGKIFGSGSRTPISITILVKNPQVINEEAQIYYHDIGDYLNQKEKLSIVKNFRTVSNPDMKWRTLKPNNHGDWINKRNDIFETFIPMAPEKKFNMKNSSFFALNGPGIVTSRDSWAYNSSLSSLKQNISNMISFYNQQRELYIKNKSISIRGEDFIDNDPRKISWTRSLRNYLKRGEEIYFNQKSLKQSLYRPFNKLFLYYSKDLTESSGIQMNLYKNINEDKSIIITGRGSSKDFSCLMSNSIVCMDMIEKAQVFPLFHYEKSQKANSNLFDNSEEEYIRRDGVSDFILERAKNQYGKEVTKEHIFYYVYGILHSPDYRTTFENDLKKMLPRIPLVDNVRDFWKFSQAGEQLAELHLYYETVEPYDGIQISMPIADLDQDEYTLYRVQKMKFPKKGQMDTIIYNNKITISNIPEKAYEYQINGKSAIHWIMERYQVSVDKKSGIKNDPNNWSLEHEKPRYIFDLLLSIINVSVQTVDIVQSLPKLDFSEEESEKL